MPRRKKSEGRRALEFAVILAVAGLAFGALSLWRAHGARAAAFAGAGVGILVLALAARPLWIRIFRLWMALAEAIGWVMTRVLLTVVYYVALTPLGLFRRWTGRPTLETAWRDGKASYWIDREPAGTTIERYEKRF